MPETSFRPARYGVARQRDLDAVRERVAFEIAIGRVANLGRHAGDLLHDAADAEVVRNAPAVRDRR